MLVFIAIAVGLVWILLARDRGQKKPVGALWIAFGFGALAFVAAILVEILLVPTKYTSHISQHYALSLAAFLLVGVIEESLKFVPMAVFVYRKKYFNEHTDGVIYFVIAGIGFGLPENILYTVSYGNGTGFARVLLTPFFHAAITGIVGYYLSKTKIDHKSKLTIVFALLGAMLVHGVYDFGLKSGNILLVVLSLMITILLSIGLFLYFMRAKELDAAEHLSAVGHNSFCRACGKPNPNHYLYCIYCGQRA